MSEQERSVKSETHAPAATEAPTVNPNFGSALQRKLQRRLAQRKLDSAGGSAKEPGQVHAAAERGVAGPGGALPHAGAIQESFGRHDVSGVQAHTGGAAAEATHEMGAEAFATGNDIAFGGGGAPSLHTAAHEAAHVVQQRGGVQLKGGVGAEGDTHEVHADKVADAVVSGKSAEGLLDQYSPAGGAPKAVQHALLPKLGAPPIAAGTVATIIATAVDKEPAPKKSGTDWSGGDNKAARKTFKDVCAVTDLTKMDAAVANPLLLQPGQIHGNTEYKNKSGDLPATTTYKEYDTSAYAGDPKLRGSDRIVVGADGKRYYTSDHYKNFAEF